MKTTQKGFYLLEGLISLFLFLLIVLFSLDCFLSLREHFAELKRSETANTAAYAALDRIRRDLLDAGSGLSEAMKFKVVEGISEQLGKLVVLSKEKDLLIEGVLYSGQQKIFTPDAPNIKRGHLIGIVSPLGGEVHSVISADQNSILIDSALSSDYLHKNTTILLLRRISIFFDDTKDVVRRKVNASPAQPLLEDVASFDFEYSRDNNLVRLDLALKTKEEKKYETTVFPKNVAMAPNLREK